MKVKIIKSIMLSLILSWLFSSGCSAAKTEQFDGSQALDYAETLLSFGPRIPGSPASAQSLNYIQKELKQYGWQVQIQDFTFSGIALHNIIAYKQSGTPEVLFGTHYDTRQISDQESSTSLQALPVPGANDGTSGTAVLLEMARILQDDTRNVWLVFFDGEDQGHIHDWDWSLGAQYFVDHLVTIPEKVVIIDMIGDQDLNIYRETQSSDWLCDEIWQTAQNLGFDDKIINEEKYTMIDDHLPFINHGIPTCLLIDFDYPYWHTQSDTLDHISGDSLQVVGKVLTEWLRSP